MTFQIEVCYLPQDNLDQHYDKLREEARRLVDRSSLLRAHYETLSNTINDLISDYQRAINWNCQDQVGLLIERQMRALRQSATEKVEHLKATSEKMTRLVPLISRFDKWGDYVTKSILVAFTSIEQLRAIDKRATAFFTLMTAKIDNEQRQGIFVSISAARLEYFDTLALSLIRTMREREEFDRSYSLLKKLIALELGPEQEGDDEYVMSMFQILLIGLGLPEWALIENDEGVEKE